MKRIILVISVLMLIVATGSAQRFRGGGGFRGGGFRGGFGRGGYGYHGGYGYRYFGGAYLGIGLGLGLGYYYSPWSYGYPYYNPYYYPYSPYSPYYSEPPAYEEAPPQSRPPANSYNDKENGGYYNNDTIYSQKPTTPGPGTSGNGNSSRAWVPAHWKHTDEGWIWIDGYWKNQ
jgi:hypothetical protein